jgi:hypothetical protein
MSVGGIASFLQGAVSSWGQTQSWSSSVEASDSLISAIGTAESNLGKGLAAIANGTALTRVDNQLTAEIQSVLTGGTGTSSSTSGSSTASTAKAAVPATATGTATLSYGTTLQTLGIPAGGTITVTAGQNTTTYASTGSDTVGDLLNAVNVDLPTNAQVTASLNSKGNLVLTSKNTTDSVIIGGVYALNLGFAVGNQNFKPTPGSGSSSSSSSTSSTSTATSSTSSTSSSSSSSSSKSAVTSYFTENATSAASLLADSGVAGSLVNMIA